MATDGGDVVWTIGGDVTKLDKALNKAGASVKKFGVGLSAAGAIGVGAFALVGKAALGVASDVDGASKKMVAALGVPSGMANDFAKQIKTVYGNNFGESIEQVGESMTDVFTQFSRVTDGVEEDLADLTQAAFSVADAFDVEVGEAASAAATLMENFGLSSTEALDMVASGFQQGLNAQDDFLDSIGEYSVQFAEGGASASDFFGIMQSGMSGGMLGTDKAADLFKEFRVRIQDGSDATKFALEDIGLSAEYMAAEMASGSMTAVDAFMEVQGALSNTKDSSLQMQAGVSLLGTQFEDLGGSVALNLNMMQDWASTSGGAIESLQEQYNTLPNAMEGLRRQLQLALEPMGAGLLAAINDNMPAIQGFIDQLSKMGPVLVDVMVPAFKTLLGVMITIGSKIAELAANHPKLAAGFAHVALAASAFMVVLGPLLILLPGLVTAFGFLTGGAGAAAGGIGLAGGAAGVAAGGGFATLITALAGPVGLVAVLGWTAVNLAAVDKGVKELNEANKDLEQSEVRLSAQMQKAVTQIEKNGGSIDKVALANMGLDEQMQAVHEAFKTTTNTAGVSEEAMDSVTTASDNLGGSVKDTKGAFDKAAIAADVQREQMALLRDPLDRAARKYWDIQTAAQQAAAAMQEVNQAAANAGGGMATGGVVPGMATGGVVKGYASGGETDRRLIKVGERGPELLAAPVGSRVMSHPDMMKAARQGGGGGGNVINMNATFAVDAKGIQSPREFFERMKPDVDNWLRQGLREATI